MAHLFNCSRPMYPLKQNCGSPKISTSVPAKRRRPSSTSTMNSRPVVVKHEAPPAAQPLKPHVEFSNARVRTYTVIYDEERLEKSCPWTLGWTVLDDTVNTIDQYEKNKLAASKQRSCCSSGSSSNSSSSSLTRSPTRAKRVSVDTRRTRLLSMGYSTAQLELLELPHEVQKAIKQRNTAMSRSGCGNAASHEEWGCPPLPLLRSN